MVGGCITSALLLLGGGQPELRSRSIRNCRVIGRSARGWNDVNAFVVIGVGAAQVEVGRLSTLEAEETMRQVVRGKSCQLKVWKRKGRKGKESEGGGWTSGTEGRKAQRAEATDRGGEAGRVRYLEQGRSYLEV